jgi:F-type H+-transporting ATPase subunit gamma
MISSRETKNKIRSINNTKQITRAMEMVSASKMRKSQLVALSSRSYCEKALGILGELSAHTDCGLHPLLKKSKGKMALLVITSDKGLCGGFNSNVLKTTQKLVKDKEADIIAVGKRGREFFSRRNFNIAAEFHGIGDTVRTDQVYPLAEFLIKSYQEGVYGSILAVYTNFRSTLKQETVVRQVLPVSIEGIKEIVKSIVPERGRFADSKEPEEKEESYPYNYEYVYEPSPQVVLDSLLKELLLIQVYHMILESNASEHSARMVAMKNATESAQELIDELTLAFNRARQAAITKEISEITAGAEALQ